MTGRATFRQADVERALVTAAETGSVVSIRNGVISIERYSAPAAPFVGPAVFLVRVKGFDLVKIGFSTSVSRRIRELEAGAGMGGALIELRRIPGDTRLERKLHEQFAGQRLFGEWFRLSGPIEDWLAETA